MPTENPKRPRVAIIGGGVAGSLAAIALAKLPQTGSFTIFDHKAAFGRGLAYSATANWHRINVPAYKMGGLGADDTEGFQDWLKETGQTSWQNYSESFVPRRIYGDYVTSHLSDIVRQGRVVTRGDAIIQIERQRGAYRLTAQSGDDIDADLVFCCLGNPPPSPFPTIEPSHRSITDVWAPHALNAIGNDDRVLVIGTGATAVDIVIDLVRRGIRQPITMVSRRGLLPLIDAPAESDPEPLAIWPETTTRGLFAMLLKDARRRMAAGLPWQTTVDLFRQQIAGIWVHASQTERDRFSRHLRSIWLVHRHRLAPDVAHLLDLLRKQKQLNVIAGRLVSATATSTGHDTTIRQRGGSDAYIATNWILNCTGPEERYDRIHNPLVTAMLASGIARTGHNGIGLDVDETCRLRGTDGHPHPGLYAIGHATRGAFWEVTAVSNIRQQVLGIVETLKASGFAGTR